MSRSNSKIAVSQLQTSLFDEATLATGAAQLNQDSTTAPPPVPPARQDGRSTAVWRQWLSSMASDAEAALAAAIAYREMDSNGRDEWLASLELDAPQVDVPSVALYAPLLAVEQDPNRREKLLFALEKSPAPPASQAQSSALVGQSGSIRVYVIASPLYLEFVQVLACGVKQGVFEWVRQDPIVGVDGVPVQGDELEGARLEKAPLKASLDELASAVLSHQRTGLELPDALSVLGDLLGPLGP